MTENKRYIDDGFEAIEDQSFTDTETDKTYYVDYFDEIVDLVNEQDKQIQELLSCNHGLVQKQIRMFDKIIQLEKENEQLKQSEKDCQEWNHKLINENEQLKQSNQKAIGLIDDGIVEMHDGKRDYAEKLFNKAIELIKWWYNG